MYGRWSRREDPGGRQGLHLFRGVGCGRDVLQVIRRVDRRRRVPGTLVKKWVSSVYDGGTPFTGSSGRVSRDRSEFPRLAWDWGRPRSETRSPDNGWCRSPKIVVVGVVHRTEPLNDDSGRLEPEPTPLRPPEKSRLGRESVPKVSHPGTTVSPNDLLHRPVHSETTLRPSTLKNLRRGTVASGRVQSVPGGKDRLEAREDAVTPEPRLDPLGFSCGQGGKR